VKYGKRPRLSVRDIELLFIIGLVVVGVMATLVGADIRLSQGLSGGGGFFGPWEAARAFLFKNSDPYGETVAALAQQDAYGRAAQVGENRYFLQVPFFLMPAYFPFAFIADPATARGIWLFVSELAVAATALLMLRLAQWQAQPWFQVAFTLACVFSLYSVISLLDGGPAALLGLVYCAALYAYVTEQDELAGALLVAALFAWEIGLFFVVLLLWNSAYEKRWRVWIGAGMALFVLGFVSFLIYPKWLFPFSVAFVATLRAPFGTNSAAILERLSPAYGEHAAQALTVLLIILLLYEWSATRGKEARRFMWTACLTLAVTPLVGLRIELGNLVVMLPSLALVLVGIARRWRAGGWLAALVLLIGFLLPWGWFVRWYWLRDGLAHDLLLLFLPVFTALGLYWTRWWFVQPPRTWLDEARAALSHTQPRPNSPRFPDMTG
jgi:hypothetical protein